MIQLNEKTRNVFLFSNTDKSKNEAPLKAFEALKAALGNTALTAENFKQFAAGFQEFVNASSVKAAPAADNENPADEENAEAAKSNETGTTEEANNTAKDQAANGGAPTADIDASDGTQKKAESIKRVKPSSLLSMKA
jgi:hypothetical protein